MGHLVCPRACAVAVAQSQSRPALLRGACCSPLDRTSVCLAVVGISPMTIPSLAVEWHAPTCSSAFPLFHYHYPQH